MEEWKAIPGTEGMIEVSNKGRCRSWLRGYPFILKATPDNKGYLRLRVTINREKMSFKVHREVAKAFIPNLDNLPQVNHIDGNKNNNTVSNLEWCTNQQNAHHAIRNGLWDSNIKNALIKNAKKRKRVVAECNGVRIIFKSVTDAELFLNSRHVTDVLKGKRSHVKGWSLSYAEGGWL